MTLVIDTNIALDLLVFDDPGCASLRAALHTGSLRWLATAAMRDELARVLGYPLVAVRLARGGRDAAGVLAAFGALTQEVASAARAPCACGDPDDQKFIDLAVAHQAWLLSRDNAVLCMKKQLLALGVRARCATEFIV